MLISISIVPNIENENDSSFLWLRSRCNIYQCIILVQDIRQVWTSVKSGITKCYVAEQQKCWNDTLLQDIRHFCFLVINYELPRGITKCAISSKVSKLPTYTGHVLCWKRKKCIAVNTILLSAHFVPIPLDRAVKCTLPTTRSYISSCQNVRWIKMCKI